MSDSSKRERNAVDTLMALLPNDCGRMVAEQLAVEARFLDVAAGEEVHEYLEMATWTGFLIEGIVEGLYRAPNSKIFPAETYYPGHFLGTLPRDKDGPTYRAVTAVRILYLQRQRFSRLWIDDPNFGRAMYLQLQARYASLVRRIVDLGTQDHAGLVLGELRRVGMPHEPCANQRLAVISIDGLAARTGLEREEVASALAELTRSGTVLRPEDNTFVVTVWK